MRRGYEVLADALVEAGVSDLFGVMGEGNLELITTLQSERGVRYHAMRHENGAVAAAHGYAQAGGRLGVATVTHGPGLTNAMTGLVSASRLAAPVLLIVGDVANASDGHVQAIEHETLAIAAGAALERAKSGPTLPAVVHRAIHRAVTESRTVVLLVPVDVQELGCPEPSAQRPPAQAPALGTAAAADIERAARAIAAAERPLVLAGRGAVLAGARGELERLADAIGAPVATTLLAKGFFAGHPRDLGICGGYATPLSSEVLGGVDLVVAFGASLNGFTTRSGVLFGDATIIHCDTARSALGRTTKVDIGLLGDAREVAVQLLQALPAPLADADQRARELADAISQWTPPELLAGNSMHGRLDPARLCVTLDQVLPRDRTLAVDGGHFTQFPCTWIDVPDPSGFVFTLGFGSVGLGLAAGIGAAIARPDRLCVAVVGDGGFMMSLPELETAARLRVPIVVVVMDDGAYGAEIHHLRARGRPLDAATFVTPDLPALAVACGAEGLALDGDGALERLRAKLAGGLSGPLVVHARVDPDVVSGWFAGLVEGAAQYVRTPA
ncbi:MAG TPA: thiamine pyrophosphate-binding protein [Acidimicrobiia bacterium]|nr:thiamine pyrophosphate-binding protein [Acidimicrobiia bacterium]